MIEILTFVILVLISFSILACIYRIYKGPSIPDRVIALDTIAINALAFIAVLSIHLNSKVYFDAVLIIAIIAFVATIAIAKYLIRGDIIK